MKAVVVTPRKKGSGRVQDVATPSPRNHEASVRVIEVGVCGTDREILEGQYGEAPPGDDFLIIGHENLGRVVRPPEDSDELHEGDLCVCIVRRPDPVPCPQCAEGEFDMCANGRYTERGIKGLHGFMSESYVEDPTYLVKLPESLAEIGVLMEPLTIVEKAIMQTEAIQRRLAWTPDKAVVTGVGPVGLLATLLLRSRGYEVFAYDILDPSSARATLATEAGATYVQGGDEGRTLSSMCKETVGIDLIVESTAFPPLVFEAIDVVGPNGVVCLTGVSDGSRKLEVDAASLNLEMVLENKVVFGTVNANRRHFEAAVKDLQKFDELWPGLCHRMITRRVPIDDFGNAFDLHAGHDVKTTVTL